ncbi:MAG TPA: DUF1552 domain-containing protein [Tepidisphaeraceae bacterium]|nr:DUF1552 domain-containing protein [Tepidisphaeraceae bacterium]
MLLRGAGVAMALPLLDAMFPRLASAAAGAAAPKRRMISICATLGLHAENLFPDKPGRDYEVTPYLEPLQPVRNDFTVCSGLSHPDVDGGHPAEASFLTAAPHPGSPSFRNSISLDQFAAERLGGDTRFDSLALTTVGGTSLSWTRNGVMIPADESPSKVFTRLFLNGTARQVQGQMKKLRDGQSIMDTVNIEAKRMSQSLGKNDRDKLDEYFTSVRELEQKMVKAEEWSKKPKPKVDVQPPKDIQDRADMVGRVKLMYDLMHLAIQTDSTRLFTMEVVGTSLVVPIPGVTEAHHSLSHHGKDPHKLAQLKLIETAEMAALAEFLMKLKATKEEGSNLLDRTMVYYGSNLGNASSHDNKNMPVIVAGGGFKHGQHLAFDRQHNAPLCNLYVSMLQQLGIEADSFATGKTTLSGLEPTRAA